MNSYSSSNTSLLFRNWKTQFENLIRSACHELILCSPFVSKIGTACVLGASENLDRLNGSLVLLTDLSTRNIIAGATEPAAIEEVAGSFPLIQVFHLPRLHAKVYIADQKQAVITSGNLTGGGIRFNFECGILLDDEKLSQSLSQQILKYTELAACLSLSEIAACRSLAEELMPLIKASAPAASFSRKAMVRVQAIDEILLARRLADGPMHTVFAKTIKYLLLQHGPMGTPDIHVAVQAIHPDLCDDSIDRVIDGKRFGKKWKHAVRTSQQSLKKQGIAYLNDGKWHLVPGAGA